MSSHDSFDDRREELLEARLRRLGTRTPACRVPGCRETDPFALTGVDPNILCREHDADRRGVNWIEQHHPAGRRNSPLKVPLCANDHAVLTAEQALWPRETLRNPDSSPLLRAAAVIRGWLEILFLTMDRAVAWIPPFLEQLDRWLREQLGDRWWRHFE
jgi:hypothetical protein